MAPQGGHHGAVASTRFLRPSRLGSGWSRERQVLVIFAPESILCLRPGPDPAASIRTESTKSWHHCRGSDRLFSFRQALRRNRRFRRQRALALCSPCATTTPGSSSNWAMDAFLDCIDPEHRRLLREFSHHSWAIYSALCRAPGMQELLEQNSGLGVGLCNHATLAARPVRWPMRSIRRLLQRRKRRDIAAALGYPARQASVKLLARLAPDAATLPHLATLRDLSHHPVWARRLSHLPRIDDDIVRLLGDPVTRDRCEMSFLLELAAPTPRQTLPGLIGQMDQTFIGLDRPLPALRSIDQVLALSDEGHAMARPRARSRLGDFGPAPLQTGP